MVSFSLVGLLVIGLVVIASAKEEKIHHNGVEVYAVGQSGKIKIKKENGTEFTFEIDEVAEKDATGAAITGSDANDHRFNTIANLEFKVKNPGPTKIPDSDKIPATELGLDVDLKAAKDLKPAIKLDSRIFLAEASGNVTADGEITTIVSGSVKFNIDLSHWQWCKKPACGDKDGAFVDVSLKMKSQKDPELEDDEDRKSGFSDLYEVGEDATMQLSKKVKVDGNWKDLPDGYPKVTTTGGITKILIRLPKFTERATYDPTLQVVKEGTDTTGGSGMTSFSVLATLLSIFFTTYVLLP